MKKLMTSLLAVLLLFTGCGAQPGTPTDRLRVVTTLFAPYDFVRQIAGDAVELTLLLPPGSEAHSYEPTPQDMIRIQNCDVFIYNGGESEAWVEDLVEGLGASTKAVRMMDCVDLVTEETVEGMQTEQVDEEPVEGTQAEHEHGETEEFDEHIWNSPKNAIKITAQLRDALCAADEANAEHYRAKAAAYTEQLEQLDAEFEAVVAGGERKTVVFADRFPLRYFVDAYGLSYIAAFPGCATDTEPSAATVAALIDRVKAEKIPVVFHIELSNEKMADTVCEATGAVKLQFNACHNLTKAQFESGVTYLDLMEENVSALKEALN